MSTARDEFAEDIATADRLHKNDPPSIAIQYSYVIADELTAAGYRKPRTITTAEELDALPFEAVVRDAEGHVLERWGAPEENLWATVMVNFFIPRGDIALPATVLHEGNAS